MPRCILAILFAAFCAGCSHTSTNSPVPLTPEMFIGCTFTLISARDYTEYFFPDQDNAECSFGNKNGPVVALGNGWKIKDGHTLVFLAVSLPPGSTVENPERFSLQFRSFDETMAVTMDGQKFKRTKLKQPDGDPIETPPDTAPKTNQ